MQLADQLASGKKCGHLGGKVLLSALQHERSPAAARLAADVPPDPAILVAVASALAALTGY